MFGRKMSEEQRYNIKFCFKLGKGFTETYQMMQTVYASDCPSRTTIHRWYSMFKSGRESTEDEQRSGRPSTSTTEDNIHKVREAVRTQPKSSVRLLEQELEIPRTIVHRILVENLGLKKVNARFVPHELTDSQKMNRIDHCKDLIENSERDPQWLKSIVTGDETWCFQYDPETKRQSAEWRRPDEGNPSKLQRQKSKIKTMLLCFYDSKGIIHKEFMPPGQKSVNGVYYKAVMKRLLDRIRRVRPEYREPGSWRLLHDNAPAHTCAVVADYLAFRQVTTLYHSPYSPDLAPCDFFLFPKLHLMMKGDRYSDINEIQRSTTALLKSISQEDLAKSFNNLIERAHRCIELHGDYFE